MNNLKNWIKNFLKNKKTMHRILVGGIVAVCLVGMAAAGNADGEICRERLTATGHRQPGRSQMIRTGMTAGKQGRQASLEEETAAGAASGRRDRK